MGDDRSKCANCQLDEAGDEMSNFETAAWNWYWRTSTAYALKAGIVAQEFKGLRLKGKLKEMFLKAVSAVDQTVELIQADREQRARDAARSGR